MRRTRLKFKRKYAIIPVPVREKEVLELQEAAYITILSNGKKLVLNANTILYVLMIEKTAEIHVSGGKVYETRMKISELEEALGEGFLKVHRGCLVSAMAIHDITDRINVVFVSSPDIDGVVSKYGEYIGRQVLAESISVAENDNGSYEELDLDDFKVYVRITLN